MGKKRRNRSAQNAMEVEEAAKSAGPWMSGVKLSGADATEAAGSSAAMDTTEGLPMLQPEQPGLSHLSMKGKVIAKRGNRTRMQKKRKNLKLAKALAVVDKRDTRTHKVGLHKQFKKETKTLWLNESNKLWSAEANA
ncbi:hypothetical protein WJX72_003317 [[Myrmecia] bisecta]|uniref:Uncharacterized protein n=1 Tax=[Myrmecia] bisecta TaxID=41462 RepID=A0AAW1QEM5_9CHLO